MDCGSCGDGVCRCAPFGADGKADPQTCPGDCQQLACVAGVETPACSDANPCTLDACDPAVGSCVHSPRDASPCDDGSLCSVGDTCSGSQCVGSPNACEDGSPCTAADCAKLTGCKGTPVPDVPCNDGNACTLGDLCTAAGACSGPTQLPCDDKNPCTTDACLPTSGCSATPLDAIPCDDGYSCTTPDVCVAGLCTGGGAKLWWDLPASGTVTAGFAAAAHFDFDNVVAVGSSGSATATDGLAIAYDASGGLLWSKVIGLPAVEDRFAAVTVAGDEGAVLAAGTRGSGAAADAWWVLLNPVTGALQAEVAPPLPGPQVVAAVATGTMPDAYHIVAGRSDGAGLLLRLDSAGKLVWSKTYASPVGPGRLDGVTFDVGEDGAILAVGTAGPATAPQPWLLAVDAAGTVLWSKVAAVPGAGGLRGVILDFSNQDKMAALAVGQAWSTPAPGAAQVGKWLAIRFDGTGKVAWQKQGPAGTEFTAAIQWAEPVKDAIPPAALLVGAQVDAAGGTDALLVALDAYGNVWWTSAFGLAGAERFVAAAGIDDTDIGVLVGTRAAPGGQPRPLAVQTNEWGNFVCPGKCEPTSEFNGCYADGCNGVGCNPANGCFAITLPKSSCPP